MSVVLATEASTLWNFVLTERWVFSAEQQRAGRGWRMLMFFAMNNAALLLRGPILIYLLTDKLAIYYVLSNVISLVALTVLRYTVADKLIWGRAKSRTYAPASHSYDPRRDYSRVGSGAARARAVSRRGARRATDHPRAYRRDPIARGQRRAGCQWPAPYSLQRDLGVCGFGIDVTLGETIDVLASPILRWSPHVLYTNVVEPILRWTFVEKGYALVDKAPASALASRLI